MTDERKDEIWAMLPSDYQTYVKRWYQDVIDNNESHEHIFEGLFGSHNLTAQAEEKPKEPRFKVGDLVRYDFGFSKGKIVEVHKCGDDFVYKAETVPPYGSYANLSECWLEPYPSKNGENDENSVFSRQNCTIPTENGISDSKNQSESAESVETSAILQTIRRLRKILTTQSSTLTSLAVMGDITNECVKLLKETEEYHKMQTNIKYTKKTVTIGAIQFKDTPERICEIAEFVGADIRVNYNDPESPYIPINTLEGPMKANVGDYIIKGVKGEFYLCKPDIFEQTYERVEE